MFVTLCINVIVPLLKHLSFHHILYNSVLTHLDKVVGKCKRSRSYAVSSDSQYFINYDDEYYHCEGQIRYSLSGVKCWVYFDCTILWHIHFLTQVDSLNA